MWNNKESFSYKNHHAFLSLEDQKKTYVAFWMYYNTTKAKRDGTLVNKIKGVLVCLFVAVFA